MDFTQLVIITGIPSSITAFGFWLIKRKIDKQAAKEVCREKNQLLLYKSVFASLSLGEATAKAVQTGKCNGEMTTALKYAADCKHEHRDFLDAQAAKIIA